MAEDERRRNTDRPLEGFRDKLYRFKKAGRSKGKVKDDSKASGSVTESSTSDPGTTSVSSVTTKSIDSPGDQTTGSQELCPISELWNQAYEDLKSDLKDQKLIEKYEAIIATDLSTMVASTAQVLAPAKTSRKENMLRVLDKKMTEVKDDKWRLRFHDHEVLVEDLAKPVINMIDMADKYVSDAVSTNPYASVAWAGVGLILPIFLNPSKQSASMAMGLKTISNLIVQSSMREDLYAHRYESSKSNIAQKTFLNIHIQYREKLRELYSLILKFQAGCVRYYYSSSSSRLLSDLVKWNDWDTAIKDIEDQNTAFVELYDLMKGAMTQEDYDALYANHVEANKITKSIGNDVSDLKKAIELAQKDGSRKELLQWLTSTKPSTNYNSLIEKRGITSANWFLEDKITLRWEKESDSLLWLNGKVGSGKSVLSALAIEWITKRHRDNPEVAIAYWYFTFSDTTKQNISEMYRSLIRQLLSCRPDTPEAVKDLRQYQESGQDPDTARLEDTLAATIRGFQNVYIVIDALDECPIGNNQRESLLRSFSRLLEKVSQNLHMLWTSRSEPDIEIAFHGLTHPSTRTNFDLASRQEAVNWGIARHIDNTLAIAPCDKWPENIKKEVREALVEKADGMFQYISVQLETIRDLKRSQEIRQAIKDLPNGLDGTYDRIFEAIEPRNQKQVVSLLKWLCFSIRPLGLGELAEIFILDPEKDVPFDPSDSLFSSEAVLTCLPNLVTKLPDKEFGGPEIKFTHFSIQEYLLSQRITQRPSKDFHIEEADAHLHIANSCLAYHLHLSQDTLATTDNFQKFILWSYASDYWHQHIEKVANESLPDAIESRVAQLFDRHSRPFLNLSRITEQDWDLQLKEVSPPLYYCASLVSLWPIRYLIENGHIIDEVSDNWSSGFALQHAITEGKTEIAEFLLHRGANANTQGGHYGNALQAAVFGDNTDAVQLLLDGGADVNAQRGRFGNALQAALYFDSAETIQLLLDKGANVNAQGGVYGNALQAAIYINNSEAIQLLLDKGANVNAQGGEYRNALQAAAYHDNAETIQLLLDKGANINVQGGYFGNALQVAAYRCSFSLVKTLLDDHGALVNARGGQYGNAIQAAVAGAKYDNAKLLHSHGAEVDPPGLEWEGMLSRISEEYDGETEVGRLKEFQADPTGFLAKQDLLLEREEEEDDDDGDS